jgi:membrane-bound lytic murein transglycosylase
MDREIKKIEMTITVSNKNIEQADKFLSDYIEVVKDQGYAVLSLINDTFYTGIEYVSKLNVVYTIAIEVYVKNGELHIEDFTIYNIRNYMSTEYVPIETLKPVLRTIEIYLQKK